MICLIIIFIFNVSINKKKKKSNSRNFYSQTYLHPNTFDVNDVNAVCVMEISMDILW